MLNAFKIIFDTVIESVFPPNPLDEKLFTYSPERAFAGFPKAPQTPQPSTRSVFAYKDELVTRLVWNIKYKKNEKAVGMGAFALNETLKGMFPAGSVTVLPMPITKRRRRERGYNQCELILNEMKRLNTNSRFAFDEDWLIRVHHDSRQTLKGRTERIESAKGIFSLNGPVPKDAENGTFVIIDDVITTGSTMKEAMDTVRESGAKNVFGLSLAH